MTRLLPGSAHDIPVRVQGLPGEGGRVDGLRDERQRGKREGVPSRGLREGAAQQPRVEGERLQANGRGTAAAAHAAEEECPAAIVEVLAAEAGERQRVRVEDRSL